MTTTRHIYARAFEVAFEEWERRRRRDPALYEMPAHCGDAGVALAAHFLAILEELAGGLPWELIGHAAAPAMRELLALVPGAAFTLEGGPDEILVPCMSYARELSRADFLALSEAATAVAGVFGAFRVFDVSPALAAEGRGRRRLTISATKGGAS